MTNKEFEIYWKENRVSILLKDPEYRKATGSEKLSSGSDFLLFGIPVATGIAFMNYCTVESELLKWLLSAGVTIASFVICTIIKSMTSSATEPTDAIEQRVKKATMRKMGVTGS